MKTNPPMMKSNMFTPTCMLLAIILVSSTMHAQAPSVGTFRDGIGTITDETTASKIILSGLPATAKAVNLNILFEPESGKYFLAAEIRNASISGRAIELTNEGGRLVAPGGPALEITCIGDKCGRCVPILEQKWKVRCSCEDSPLQPGYSCSMTSKVIISMW